MADDLKTLITCVKAAYPTITGVDLYRNNAYATLAGSKSLDLADGTTLHDWGVGVGTMRVKGLVQPYR